MVKFYTFFRDMSSLIQCMQHRPNKGQRDSSAQPIFSVIIMGLNNIRYSSSISLAVCIKNLYRLLRNSEQDTFGPFLSNE